LGFDVCAETCVLLNGWRVGVGSDEKMAGMGNARGLLVRLAEELKPLRQRGRARAITSRVPGVSSRGATKRMSAK